MGIISYAQNFEDVILWRALGHIENGFYIDIGAQHPTIDSVSKAFYDAGWRGVDVEATPDYVQLLKNERPDDVVLELVVAKKEGKQIFYEIPGTGISTGCLDIVKEHEGNGFRIQEIEVKSTTLRRIFSKKMIPQDVHWLKVDVEGMEQEVLQSWGRNSLRPWVVLVESTKPLSQEESCHKWEYLLLERGYRFVYFDGLNRFYIHKEHEYLSESFKCGPNVFDQFMLSGTSSSTFHQHLFEQINLKNLEITNLREIVCKHEKTLKLRNE